MRFQALMPDILHWLGIKKIDRMLSMSKCVRNADNSTKLNSNQSQHETRCHRWPRVCLTKEGLGAITDWRSRIPIHERVELPEELIPADSRVEIDAKITAG